MRHRRRRVTILAVIAVLASTAGAVESQRRRGELATTELVLDADRRIELRFDQPSTEDAAYGAIQRPVEGKVVMLVESRPPKLETSVDLRFGDTW